MLSVQVGAKFGILGLKRYHPSMFPPSAGVLLADGPWQLIWRRRIPFLSSHSFLCVSKKRFSSKKKEKEIKPPALQRPRCGVDNILNLRFWQTLNKHKYFWGYLPFLLLFVMGKMSSGRQIPANEKILICLSLLRCYPRVSSRFPDALPAVLMMFYTVYPSVLHRFVNEESCQGAKNARHASEMHKWLHQIGQR